MQYMRLVNASCTTMLTALSSLEIARGATVGPLLARSTGSARARSPNPDRDSWYRPIDPRAGCSTPWLYRTYLPHDHAYGCDREASLTSSGRDHWQHVSFGWDRG
ncbi:hypothetical protein C8Q80DRAFT_1213249 [Daedaleopsis nitida]|nr:hypothetical protein C8Q80DRAFT_1213249 [Daedaleopsis nitida]